MTSNLLHSPKYEGIERVAAAPSEIFVKLGHSSHTDNPTNVTLFGRATVVRLRQVWKAPSPMLVSPAPKSTAARLPQLLKAYAPMVETLFGREISDRRQPVNASSSIQASPPGGRGAGRPVRRGEIYRTASPIPERGDKPGFYVVVSRTFIAENSDVRPGSARRSTARCWGSAPRWFSTLTTGCRALVRYAAISSC